MFALLAQRNVFLLWTAHTISILGDYVFFIAITFWVYAQTGSATATGAVLIISTVPLSLFAPLAGMLIDRWNRQRIMLGAESARALLFLLLFTLLLTQPHALWPIYVVGFIQSALAAFFWPARSALLPELVEPPALMAANAWYLVSDSGVRILAPTLSAFALLQIGPAGVSLFDAATFLLSAGCISLLRLTPQTASWRSSALRADHEPSAKRPAPPRPAIAGMRGLLLLGALVMYVAGTLSILLPILVQTILVAGPLAYGWMLTAQAIGEGIISLALGRFAPPTDHLKGFSVIAGGLALGGFALLLVAFLQSLWPILLLSVLFGATTGAISIPLLTLLQQRAAKHLLGRTLAAFTALQALAQVGGMAVASMLAASVGVLWLLAANGALYLLGSGCAWVLAAREVHPRASRSVSQQDNP